MDRFGAGLPTLCKQSQRGASVEVVEFAKCTTRDRSGSPAPAPAMEVDNLVLAQSMMNRIEDRPHLLLIVRDRDVANRVTEKLEAFRIDSELLSSLKRDGVVGLQFALFSEIDEDPGTRFENRGHFIVVCKVIKITRVLAAKDAIGFEPVAVCEGWFHERGLGDWEIGRLGDWEIGRLGDWEIEVTQTLLFASPAEYPANGTACSNSVRIGLVCINYAVRNGF